MSDRPASQEGPGASVRLPTPEEIRRLHERYAPTREVFDLVRTHSEIVWRLAEQRIAAGGLVVDVALVRAGSRLHDIGVYRLFDPSGKVDRRNYIRHGLLGHELLRDLGYPEALCRFCSRHTGMGLSRQDVVGQELPLPVDDYDAETEEERLVMYADKFHSKRTPPVFVSTATARARLLRHAGSHEARFMSMVERFGEPDLSMLTREYGQKVI